MFDPHNALENLISLAAQDTGHRPAFYQALLDSTLYVMGSVEPGSEEGEQGEGWGPQISDGQTLLHLTVWARGTEPIVPVFSSPERLRALTDQPVRMVGMRGRDLLSTLGRVWLVLNPGSDIMKEFPPEEVQALSDGSLFRNVTSRAFEEPTQAMIRTPTQETGPLRRALSTLFARHPEVVGAYLAEIEVPGSGVPPHPVVALDVEGDADPVVQEVGIVVSASWQERAPVDIFLLEEGNELSHFFLAEVDPFYGVSRRSPLDLERLRQLREMHQRAGSGGVAVVLGAVVQAEAALWDSGEETELFPALVVYSLSPERQLDRMWLRALALRLFALRGQSSLEPLEQALAHRLNEEGAWFHASLAPEVSGDPYTYWGTLGISRDQLPGGSLPGDGILPLYVSLPGEEEEGEEESEPLDLPPRSLWQRQQP